jgi:hypothetical protein
MTRNIGAEGRATKLQKLQAATRSAKPAKSKS